MTRSARLALVLAALAMLSLSRQPGAQPQPAAPEIVSIEFPSVIAPDGTLAQGAVTFDDPDHDALALELSVVRAFDFAPVRVPISLKVQTPGRVAFSLSSNIVQPVALEARVVDAKGQRSAPRVFHFAAVGLEREVAPGVYFINAWGQRGSGPGQFDFEGPHGVRVGPDGNVYVIDQGNHRIQVFSPQGDFLDAWGGLGRNGQPGKFNFPSDLVFSPEGNIYVSDSLNHRIQVFDPQFNPLFAWGGQGFADGQFVAPRGLAIHDGEIYVVDEQNGRIQVFDLQGHFRRKWGRLSQGGEPGTFNVIVGIDVDARGQVYVADGFNHRIQVFDPEGNFLRTWGEFGGGDGQFDDPVGVAVSPEGWVAVTDTSPIRTNNQGVLNDRVQILTTQGAFLAAWGTESDAPGTGFKLPLGAATDGLGMLYIGDHFNRRAQSFYVAINAEAVRQADAALGRAP